MTNFFFLRHHSRILLFLDFIDGLCSFQWHLIRYWALWLSSNIQPRVRLILEIILPVNVKILIVILLIEQVDEVTVLSADHYAFITDLIGLFLKIKNIMVGNFLNRWGSWHLLVLYLRFQTFYLSVCYVIDLHLGEGIAVLTHCFVVVYSYHTVHADCTGCVCIQLTVCVNFKRLELILMHNL